MRHHSPGWCCKGPASLAKGFVQWGWKICCVESEETIEHTFFHGSAVHPLYRLTEDFMVCMLRRIFFALEANFVCSNMVLLLTTMFFCLLGVMQVVVWIMQQKEYYRDRKFTSAQLIFSTQSQDQDRKAAILSIRIWCKVGDSFDIN